MLGERIITVIAILGVLLLIVFFTNNLVFSLFLSIVTLIAAWEWTKLAGIRKQVNRCLYCFGFILFCGLAYTVLQNHLLVLLSLSLTFWALSLFLICTYPRYKNHWNNPYIISFMGFLALFPCWFILLHLRDSEEFTFNFLSLIALVASADIGAYFAGKKFGKHKLAEMVSPKKTWEGVGGGIISCSFLVIVLNNSNILVQVETNNWLVLLTTPFLISFFSIVGDLFESMLKRVRGMKDSGNILPGHGGVLDRIDGVISTTPAYFLMLIYLI
ncbi:MAG: phosphatidate cytidylyltransferase [Pseudohongiellaceae bacterium]